MTDNIDAEFRRLYAAMPEEFDAAFARFDAVADVLDKHLWRDRWKLSDNPDDPDDDAANGWVGPARAELATLIEESILLRRDGDPASAEADFADFRDYCLWQAMVNLARSEDGLDCIDCGCTCSCHDGKATS